MTVTERVEPSRDPLMPVLIAISLLAAAVTILGDVLDIGWMGYAQWLCVPPLALVLVRVSGLDDRRGRWWLAGLTLSWLGDVLGDLDFLVLLGCFLLAHACYVVALWPTRQRSLLGKPGSIPYLVLGIAGLVLLIPAAGAAMAVPVTLYAAALTLMALLASAGGRAGVAGVAGGMLFMISDLVLGMGTFAVDLPTAVQTTLVIGTYVPAQVLLLLAVLGLLERPVSAVESRRSTV